MGIYAVAGQQADDEIGTLTAQLAAVTAERDRLADLLDDVEPPPDPDPEPEPEPTARNGIVAGKTWFGAASGNLANLESKVGRLGVFRSYYQASQTAGMVQRAQADHAAGRIPWISTKLPAGWAAMASGSGDTWARDLAGRLGALGKPVWIALHHEPENDGTMPDWVRLQQRMAPIFKAHANIAYTVILMGWHQWQTSGGANSMDSLWPGRQFVDLLAFDPYNWYDTTNSSGKKTMTWTELKAGYYDKIVAWLKATGNESVAWGIAETGYTDSAAALGSAPSGRGTGADWIGRAYDDMKTLGGQVLTYFDVSAAVNNEPSDWTWPITTTAKTDAVKKVVGRADRPQL